MKKSLFFLPLALGLFACTNDEVVNSPDNDVKGDTEVSYLAVNIKASNEMGTRAEGDLIFSVGSEAENKVNAVRFYFFGKDKKAVAVKGNGATYYDAKTEDLSNDYQSNNEGKNENVESTISAMIIIESPKKDKKPYYVAVVVNPTPTTPSLTEGQGFEVLEEHLENYLSPSSFVMSSTVYSKPTEEYNDLDKIIPKADDTNMVFNMIPVYEKIKPSRLEALDDKATVHVERVLAKVSTQINIKNGEKIGNDDSNYMIYPVGTIDKGAVEGKEKIYVKFLGWNTTATRKTSRLVKKINENWPEFTGWKGSWNDISNHRSYWAINPKENKLETDYNYGPFAAETSKGSGTFKAGEDCAWNLGFGEDTRPSYTYLQENAGSFSNSTGNDELSKIIVAAQLVDEEGNSLELVEWGGNVYTKDAVMDAIAAATDLYIVDAEKGTKDQPEEGRYTQLQGKDIELEITKFENADDAYKFVGPRYYVTVKLDENVKYAIYTFDKENQDKGYYFDETADGGGYSYKDGDDINSKIKEALDGVGKIKYWNTGYTYYWVNIKHLGGTVSSDDDTQVEGIGMYGVVRNHWYNYTFTSVKGLGVPVADPNEPIYPEKPDDPNLFYLAAEIEILSWRMVNHDEGLGWD